MTVAATLPWAPAAPASRPRIAWPRRLLALARRAAEEPIAGPRLAATGIDALRRRDPGAWRDFFSAEMPAIYRYALSRLGNTSDAEDLAGQVFEEAWEHSASLEDRGLPARVWLFGIARNLINTHRRRFFRQPPPLAIETFDAPLVEPGMDASNLDLARAISQLSAGHAEVISLRFLHGLSLQETAEVLRTSVDGVKGRQARALTELRQRLS